MLFHPRVLLAFACLLMSIWTEVDAQDTRRSRSINDLVYQPRSNSIRFEGRDHDPRGRLVTVRNYNEKSDPPVRTSDVSGEADRTDDVRRTQEEDEKLFRAMVSKDFHGTSPSELEKFDRIGDRIIARANMTEEAKRVVRQVKRERPGFFWTIARVAFESVNETRSAIQQISSLVEGAIAPDPTTQRVGTHAALMTGKITTTERTTTQPTGSSNSTETTTEATTTEEPYMLTRTGLQGIVRRNFRGLIRLFNIEWRDAINQSQTNLREFQKDLGSKISPFLQDNPDVV